MSTSAAIEALTDGTADRGHLVLDADVGELTTEGLAFLAGLGIDIRSPTRSRRAFCLDWSERRSHLAGRVGASIADLALKRI
jgi:hypothetical protein